MPNVATSVEQVLSESDPVTKAMKKDKKKTQVQKKKEEIKNQGEYYTED